MTLPVIVARGKGIAEVWEKSLLLLWKHGIGMPTEYDQKNEPQSCDATMIMVVNNPFAEPRIHLGFPGGIEDLEKYRQEIVDGVHDHWINPEQGKWTYTYHQRLFNYGIAGSANGVNQVEYIVEKLARATYSRRAQAITWIPGFDPRTDDPPCLQRIWCRMFPDKKGRFFLRMNTHWRSRDAYRAAFMNIFGLTELQKHITQKISAKIGKPVFCGQYVDITDSYHIYGSSLGDFQSRFLSIMKQRKFHDPANRLNSRTLRSDDPSVIAGFEYGRELLAREKDGT